jgi:hypothetical protein
MNSFSQLGNSVGYNKKSNLTADCQLESKEEVGLSRSLKHSDSCCLLPVQMFTSSFLLSPVSWICHITVLNGPLSYLVKPNKIHYGLGDFSLLLLLFPCLAVNYLARRNKSNFKDNIGKFPLFSIFRSNNCSGWLSTLTCFP